MNPLVTIIIATFNSEKFLPRVLNAISEQNYPKNKIEILLVDGGSIDETIFIAKKYKCRIIKNPRTEPVYGKYLAFLKSRGKYVMYVDHDEVMLNKNSISSKVLALTENSGVKAVAGGNYRSPMGYPFINEYINEFGDPFSFFIYRISKRDGFFLNSMLKKYPVKRQTRKCAVFDLSDVNNLPLIELVAGGSMFDAEYLKKEFPETKEKMELLPHYFYLLYSKYPEVIVMKNDPILHYSADTMQKYLKKITWRVKNNIYFYSTMGKSGYSGREDFQFGFFKLKKLLFIPYSFSLILPLIDSVYLIITRHNYYYVLHLLLCLYTASLISYHYILKFFGYNPKLRSYDGSKEVK